MTTKSHSSLSKTKSHAALSQEHNLVDQLDGALRRLMWVERSWLKQTLDEFDLDVVPFMLLMYLRKHNETCPIGELAHALGQPNATTTGHVDRLEQKGLVKREFGNQQDRRQVRVHVTTQGTALVRRVQQLRQEHLKRVLSHIDAREQRALLQRLENYLNAFEAVK